MSIEEIEKLSDVLPIETLALLFQNVLNELEMIKIDKREFLLILSHLTDRQVMTYELLESEIRNNIDEVLCKLWNTESYEDVDIILSIVVNLGLKNYFQKIKDSIHQNKNINEIILNEIIETIDEVGENISNPYHGLEKYK